MQIDTNQASTSGTHDDDQHRSQASGSNQLPILQPTSIARDHPLNQVIDGIKSGVQTRSRLASFCENYSFVSFEEPKKIEDVLKVSMVSVRGTLTNTHNKITRRQVEALNSTL